MKRVARRTIEPVPVRGDGQPQHGIARRELECTWHYSKIVKARVDFDGSAKYAGFPTEVPPPQRSELRFCSDSQYKR